jgi:hypothetical protein
LFVVLLRAGRAYHWFVALQDAAYARLPMLEQSQECGLMFLLFKDT